MDVSQGWGLGTGGDAGHGPVRGPGPGPGRKQSGAGRPGAGAVRVDIGALVLSGFGRTVDPDRVAAAFEAELTRLVHERGVPLAADGDGRAVDALAGLPPLPANLSSRRLGQELARAVHDGLAGRGERTSEPTSRRTSGRGGTA